MQRARVLLSISFRFPVYAIYHPRLGKRRLFVLQTMPISKISRNTNPTCCPSMLFPRRESPRSPNSLHSALYSGAWGPAANHRCMPRCKYVQPLIHKIHRAMCLRTQCRRPLARLAHMAYSVIELRWPSSGVTAGLCCFGMTE